MNRYLENIISLGLVGVNVASITFTNVQSDWVQGNTISSRLDLRNDSTSDAFWFYDVVSNTLHVKGDTILDFIVDINTLSSPLSKIEIYDSTNGVVLHDTVNSNLSVPFKDIPSGVDLELVYTLDDGTEERVPFYDYFTFIQGNITSHVVDDVDPSMTFIDRVDNDSVVSDKYIKANLVYNFQGDVYDSTLANIWGTTGYKYELYINKNKIEDTSVFEVSHDADSGLMGFKVNLSNITPSLNGECNIELIVYDNVGNKSSYTDTVFVDYSAPLIEGVTANNYKNIEGVTYFNSSDTVEISYSVRDDYSGISSVEILKGSDVISTSSSGTFTVDSEEVYSARVVDNIGNTKEYTLSEICPGLENTVKFDNSAPTLSHIDTGLDNGYFKENSTIQIDASDDVGLYEVEYTINRGKPVVELLQGSKTYSKVFIANDFSGLSGNIVFEFRATDMLGNEEVYSTTVNVDTLAPDFNGTISGDIRVHDGKAYSKDSVVIDGVANDTGSGVKSISVVKDGVGEVADSLPYSIDSSGIYRVVVEDNAGNINTIELKSLIGKEFDELYIDKSSPVIDIKVDGNDLQDTWYNASSKDLVLSGSDDIGIKKIKYTINGVTEELTDLGTNHSVTYSFSSLADVNGIIDISYSIEDYAGNIETYNKVIKVDTEAPKIEDISTTGSYILIGNIAFIRGSFTLDASVSDEISGVSSVEVLRGNKVVGDSLPYVIDSSGSYSVRITDKAGNVVTKSLKDLLNDNISDVVVDNDKPILDIKLNGETVQDTWYKDVADLVINISDGSAIDSISYSVNGVTTEDNNIVGNTHTLNLNLLDLVNDKGIAEFSITVKDCLGNTEVYNHTFKVDTSNPIIVSSSLSNKVFVEERTGFIDRGTVLNADIVDSESGVASIEVIRNGVVVATSLPYTINDSGEYSIKVVDKVGHSITRSVFELLGLDIDSFTVDYLKPVVGRVDGFIPDLVKDEKNWYNRLPSFNISVVDDNISTVEIKVNGEAVVTSPSSNGTYNIPVVGGDGDYVIEVVATDKIGNKVEDVFNFSVDTGKPKLTEGNLVGDYLSRDNGLYFKSTPSLSVKGNDTGIGINYYELLSDTGVVLDTDSAGDFVLGTGEYFVRAVDYLGNKSDIVKVSDLCRLSHNKVVVDSAKPVINVSRPDSTKDDWYTDKVNYSISVSDTKGVFKADLYVNGVIVDSYHSSSGDANVSLSATVLDTVAYNDIKVVAEDGAGNTSEWSESIKVDYTPPKLVDAKMKSKGVVRPSGTYFSSEPSISLSFADGVQKEGVAELLDSSGTVLDRNSTGIFTIDRSDYLYRFIDALGNKTSPKPISDEISELKDMNIIVDSSKPTFKVGMPIPIVDNWYSDDKVFKIGINDNIGVFEAYVEINGVKVDSFSSVDGEKDLSLTVDTSKVKSDNGVYVITCKAIDGALNESTWSSEIRIDKDAPSIIKSSILSDYHYSGDYVVFRKEPVLSLEASDNNGSGFKSYQLIDDKGQITEDSIGQFTLFNGEYSVALTDNVGNTSTPITLDKLLGLKSNKILIDLGKPTINYSRDDKKWFNSDIDYTINVSDDVAISNIKVSINGSEVSNIPMTENNIPKYSFNVSTKGINPNSDGSFNVSIECTDIVGNTEIVTDTVYQDTYSPVIDKFIISGTGYKEGSISKGGSDYGFYFNGEALVEVHISDGDYSSGLGILEYKLVNDNGEVSEGTSSISNGVSVIKIPKDFKGYLSARAFDLAGNVGEWNEPDGIITSKSNTSVNPSNISISLPETIYKDNRGYNLYNSSVSLSSSISDSYSGLRKVMWGIDGNTVGELSIDNKGNLSGDTASVNKKDNNLVVDLSKSLPVSDNRNNLNVWVSTENRLGEVSKTDRFLSIDTDAPEISVTYDTNNSNNCYNSDRVALVTIKERNFNSGDVKFLGSLGSVGNWVNIGEDTWQCSIVFSADGDYQWSVGYTDLAGNVGNIYSSESFTVDKTSPVLDVTFNNNEVENGNFYKDSRVATVTVVERNFNPSNVSIEGGVLSSGWNSIGDTHTALVSFHEDGEYNLSVGVVDNAGNNSSNYHSSPFIIDKGAPSVIITGVQDGVSYSNSVIFKVNVSDTYIDESRSSVVLTGRTTGVQELKGGFNGQTGEFTFDGIKDTKDFDDLYSLEVVIYDKAGNSHKENLSFSVNRFGSSYSYAKDLMRNSIVSSVSDIVLQEYSVDRLDLSSAKVSISRDGVEMNTPEKSFSVEESGGSDSKWLYTYTISKDIFKEDGKYVVQVYSKTLGGTGNSSLKEEYAFLLDTTKPDIIVSGVSSNKTYNDVKKKVSIDVRDLSGISSIKVFLNGKEVSVSNKYDVYELYIEESKDKQDLYIEVIDNAGNIATSSIENIFISSNIVQLAFNSIYVKIILGLLGVVSLVLMYIATKRRIRRKRKEMDLALEHARLYKNSVSENISEDS